jgi:hypothetical protein
MHRDFISPTDLLPSTLPAAEMMYSMSLQVRLDALHLSLAVAFLRIIVCTVQKEGWLAVQGKAGHLLRQQLGWGYQGSLINANVVITRP